METSASGTSTAGETPKSQRMRRYASLALCALAALFAVLNLHEVRVDFIIGTARAPLIVVIVACLAVGLALGLLAGRKRAT